MSKHTPGPWVAVNEGTKAEPMMTVKAARISGQPPRHCVAICATGDSVQEMEDANAALIAAAPDMYEALKAFHPSQIKAQGDLARAWETARAAIAKAEGRS